MNKMRLGFAAMAVVLAGCSAEETDKLVLQESNAINFMTSTTKASINRIDELKTGGFKVYANQSGKTASNAWYLEDQAYVFDGVWTWDPLGSGYVTTWPTAEVGSYPMDFYAYFPQSATGFDLIPGSVASGVASLSATITTQSPSVTAGVVSTNQVDYMAGKASTAAKPGNGFLSLTFNHIMSKINASIIAGNATKVYVQALKFQEPATERTFSYTAKAWSSTEAITRGEVTYLNKATTGFTGDANVKALICVGTDPSEETISSIYSTPHSTNLMLIPQTLAPWVITPGVVDRPLADGSEAYIEVIYRVTDDADIDLIGYTKAQDAPGWVSTPPPNRPLFIRVGFPLAATWEMGKGYTYHIKLGTADASGGHYLSDHYYDENGLETSILIKNGGGVDVKPGDPVSSGTIGFTVSVADWTDTPGSVLE